MPRFASASDDSDADLDVPDDGFAVTSAWDAPVDGRGIDGWNEQPASAPVEGDLGPSPEPRIEPDHQANGALDMGYEAQNGHADAFAEPPTELDHTPSAAAADRDEDGDDLGPPAPFFAPFAPAPSANGSLAPVERAPMRTAPDGGESSSSEAPAPGTSLPSPESGRTLPFWLVPSEPERPKRRLSLKNLRRPRLRRPTRAGLMRALPIVLLVVGALLLLEGALTVFWKEPFSAIFAAQSQSALGDDLDKLERDGAAAEAAARGQKAAVAYQRRRSVSLNRDAGISKPVGRLKIDKIDLNTVVVQGTDEEVSLKKGPGHYTETPLPGQKGNWTVGIAGHRTTYDAPFRDINKLKRGDDIVFSTPYGKFTYAVEGTKIVDDSETGVFEPKNYDRIALTACHPLYSAAQRIIAYGKLKKSEPLGKARRAARS